MPRQKLYHTQEEKRAANNAKSLRSYHKNKEKVSIRRKRKYHKNQKSTQATEAPKGKVSTKELSTKQLMEMSPKAAKRNLTAWCRNRDGIVRRFNNFIASSPSTYVELIFQKHITHPHNNEFDKAYTLIREFEKEIASCQANILQFEGVGNEWKTCEKASQDISHVIGWLEDLLTVVLTEPIEELIALHESKSLIYQS
ncbi:hypothetical protein C0992_000362 [Termitomyces sp. T32_za158]|nr:hypothetical protein C0992_000362 [Termitomyces sp. T32_za158]